MNINEKIRQRRKELNLAGDMVAKELGISRATYYRYETTTEKVPASILDSLCKVLKTTPAYFLNMQSDCFSTSVSVLPNTFTSPQEAVEFILKIPTLAAFGGYDPNNMTEEQLIEFGNELLQQLKLVSYKYKK